MFCTQESQVRTGLPRGLAVTSGPQTIAPRFSNDAVQWLLVQDIQIYVDTSQNGSAWISIFIFLLAFVFIRLQSPGQSDTRHAQPLYGLQHYTPPHGCQTNCIHSRLPARPTGARSEKHGETFLSTIKISQNQPHPTSPNVGCLTVLCLAVVRCHSGGYRVIS